MIWNSLQLIQNSLISGYKHLMIKGYGVTRISIAWRILVICMRNGGRRFLSVSLLLVYPHNEVGLITAVPMECWCMTNGGTCSALISHLWI